MNRGSMPSNLLKLGQFYEHAIINYCSHFSNLEFNVTQYLEMYKTTTAVSKEGDLFIFNQAPTGIGVYHQNLPKTRPQEQKDLFYSRNGI